MGHWPLAENITIINSGDSVKVSPSIEFMFEDDIECKKNADRFYLPGNLGAGSKYLSVKRTKCAVKIVLNLQEKGVLETPADVESVID